MEKDDILTKLTLYLEGSKLLGNVENQAQAERFMELEFAKQYPGATLPNWQLLEDKDNPGSLAIIATTKFTTREEARVNWVVGDEASISHLDRPESSSIITLPSDAWVITKKAQNFTSELATLSDEELRNRIEELRGKRVTIPPKVATKKSPALINPLEAKLQAILATLSEDDKIKLKAKLGII